MFTAMWVVVKPMAVKVVTTAPPRSSMAVAPAGRGSWKVRLETLSTASAAWPAMARPWGEPETMSEEKASRPSLPESRKMPVPWLPPATALAESVRAMPPPVRTRPAPAAVFAARALA